MANKKVSMVGSITSLLKQVHIFNYTQNASMSVDSLDMGFNSIPSSSSLASDDSLSQDTQYQGISYSDSNFSVGTPSDYDSATHISESLTSYTDFSDTEEDNLDDCETSSKSRKEKNKQSLPEYSLNEVAQHDMMHDCWIVFYDKVYDVTQFLFEHPGGEELLMEHAGRDGTIAFRGVGHSKAALQSLQEYLIGVLPPSERIFSTWDLH